MFQIVHGTDVAHGSTASSHEDGMGDGFVADEFDARQEGLSMMPVAQKMALSPVTMVLDR